MHRVRKTGRRTLAPTQSGAAAASISKALGSTGENSRPRDISGRRTAGAEPDYALEAANSRSCGGAGRLVRKTTSLTTTPCAIYLRAAGCEECAACVEHCAASPSIEVLRRYWFVRCPVGMREYFPACVPNYVYRACGKRVGGYGVCLEFRQPTDNCGFFATCGGWPRPGEFPLPNWLAR